MDSGALPFQRDMVDYTTVTEEHFNAARNLAFYCCQRIGHLPFIIRSVPKGWPGGWPTLEQFDHYEEWIAPTLHRPAVLRAIELGNARVDTSVRCFDRIVPTMHEAAAKSIQELVILLESDLSQWGEPRCLARSDDGTETTQYRKYPPSKLAKVWTTLLPLIEDGCPWLADWESRLSVEWRNALDWLAKREPSSWAPEVVNTIEWSEWNPPAYWARRFHCAWRTIRRRVQRGELHGEKRNEQSWRFLQSQIPSSEKLTKS